MKSLSIKRKLSPLELEVILHYYYSPEPFSRLSSAYFEAILKFIRNGILRKREEISSHGAEYEITEKGHFFLNMLTETPFPIQSFRDPRDESTHN